MIESTEMTDHVRELILSKLFPKQGIFWGKEIKTPEDEFVYSYKFTSPFNVDIRLKGNIEPIEITATISFNS